MTAFGFGADRLGWTDGELELVRELRGWTEAAIERLELTFDEASGVVGIPIRDETLDLIGALQYLPDPRQRNGRRKMAQPSGVPRQLFPPPETLGHEVERVLVTEGEPDAVTAWSHGFAAIGVPGTAGWRPEYAARLAGRRWRVYVVFDCDESGRNAALEVVRSLIAVGVDARIVELDDERHDGYDLTDLLTSLGPPALEASLELAYVPDLPTAPDESPWRAQPWPVFRDEAPEEHRWIVDGLLPAGVLAFIAGPPKRGKTWLGLAVSLAIATGRPLLDYVTHACPVLYAALEGSRTGLRARIGALARGLGADPESDELDGLHLLYRPRPFNLVELATAGWLADEAARVDAGLVVVDVLRAAARFQENVAEDFARVRDSLEPLFADERTVLLLHHFGKMSETQKERSPGERMAGTGAMYGALDVGLLITSSTDHARHMRVDVEARDFAAPEALGIAIVGDGSGEHGGFTYLDTATLELDTDLVGGRDYVGELEALFADGEWRTRDELAMALGVKRELVSELIDLDTKTRSELAQSPRIVRWNADGRVLGRHHSARPYGTPAMLEQYDSLLAPPPGEQG